MPYYVGSSNLSGDWEKKTEREAIEHAKKVCMETDKDVRVVKVVAVVSPVRPVKVRKVK